MEGRAPFVGRAWRGSPFSAGEGPPSSGPVAGACDCHVHIFEPRFPAANQALGLASEDASPDQYRRFQDRIGTDRLVVVTPSTYGVDNRATLAGLEAFGAASRGVVVIDAMDPPPDLESMSEEGVCGIRVNFVTPQTWGPTTIERLEATALIAANLGWHIQIYATSSQIADLAPALGKLPTSVVIDHLASVRPEDQNGEGHLAALRLLEGGRVWLKLSGAYIVSRHGPDFQDVDAVAQSYVETAPERLVWGSDWPHRTQRDPFPDDARLFDALSRWVSSEEVRHRILVLNPAELYGFETA